MNIHIPLPARAARGPLALLGVLVALAVCLAGYATARLRIAGHPTTEVKVLLCVSALAAAGTIFAGYWFRWAIERPPAPENRCTDAMMVDRLIHVWRMLSDPLLMGHDPARLEYLTGLSTAMHTRRVEGTADRALMLLESLGRLQLHLERDLQRGDLAASGVVGSGVYTVADLLNNLAVLDCPAALHAGLAALGGDVLHPADVDELMLAWDAYPLPRHPLSPSAGTAPEIPEPVPAHP